MRITNVETILLADSGGSSSAEWSGGTLQGWSAAFIRISTDQRIDGIGECYFGLFAPETVPPIVDNLKPLLLGEDPFRIPYLVRKLGQVTKFWNRHGLGKSVIGAADLALHDLVGKALRLPVYQLLGGLYHPSIATYASAGLTPSKDGLLSEMRQAIKDGFRAYKWRLVDPTCAEPLMKALREEAGPDFGLMIDFVQGSAPQPWSKQVVMEAATAIAPYQPAFIEEPFTIEDKRAHRELRRRVACPVAAGEGISSIEETRQFLDAQAVDVLQPDVAIAGGIITCRTIGVLAEAEGVTIASHSWGGAGSLMGNLHFALANASSSLVEYPRVASPFRDPMLEEPLEIKDGRILPPKASGLGIRLDDSVADRYRFRGKAGHSFRWVEDVPSNEVPISTNA